MTGTDAQRGIEPEEMSVVVAGGDLESASVVIRAQFPKMAIEMCGSGEELVRAVVLLRPKVAYIAKSTAISRENWRQLLDSPGLKWLHLGNIGFDHVPSWDRTKIVVTNSGGAAADSMAEYVISAIMMINSGFLCYLDNQSRRLWKQHDWIPLSERTLTVLGVGHIGQRVLDKARRLGMRVIVVRERPDQVVGAHLTFPSSELHRGLELADYVAIQIPLNDRTENLIDAQALDHMRKTAWLINISRGAIIDDVALAGALRRGLIGGAVLDVFRTEPLPPDSVFWGLRNTVVTPHNSGQVVNFYKITATMFCANLHRFLAGVPLKNIV